VPSSLKQSVKNHYEGKCLSKGQLDELMSLQNRPKKFKYYELAALSVVAASIIFVIINSVYFYTDSVGKKIIQEVAYNHNKKMEPEFFTSSISEIQSKLDRLDFTLIQPSKIASADWIFLGGRYCSIQGKIAAQLKIKNRKSNAVYTLYELPIQKGWKRDGLTGASEAVDGVIVDIWLEKGLLLALAGPGEN